MARVVCCLFFLQGVRVGRREEGTRGQRQREALGGLTGVKGSSSPEVEGVDRAHRHPQCQPATLFAYLGIISPGTTVLPASSPPNRDHVQESSVL